MLPLLHETWFAEQDGGLDWDFATETATLALLGAAVAATLLVRMLAAVVPGVDIPSLARLAPWMPFAVRIHLAVSLLGLLSMGHYLSPAMELDKDLAGVLLGAVMAIVTVGMATGWYARWAAALLLAAGPIGMLEFGFSPILQRVDLVGLALFVLLAGAGRWSADHELGRAGEPTREQVAAAVFALRVAAGVALIVVAFVEKLADPDLARRFLDEYPAFNVADALGLPITETEFIRLAGAVEVLFGLLLISGALPQAIVVIAGVPFNATLFFMGAEELVGHLPIYGAMLVLLVYGSSSEYRPLVADLRPWRGGVPRPAPGRARARARAAVRP